MRDPYDVLGIPRTASEAEIKKAFRRRAKNLHPDTNKDNPKAAEQFAELNAAHALLSDPNQRAAFDRGEIDAEGKPRFQGFGGFGSGGGFRARSGGHGFRSSSMFGQRDDADLDDIFSDLFGHGGAGSAGIKGADISVTLPLSLADAILGASHHIALPTGSRLDVRIPPGVADGTPLRLRGKGMPSPVGGPSGDAVVTVRIEPHPLFKPDGSNLRLDLPISLPEAVLGAKIRVPTLEGAVDLNITAGSNAGRTLRLRGRGGRKSTGERGDMLVTLRIVLPEAADPALEDLMRTWNRENPYRVRGPEFEG